MSLNTRHKTSQVLLKQQRAIDDLEICFEESSRHCKSKIARISQCISVHCSAHQGGTPPEILHSSLIGRVAYQSLRWRLVARDLPSFSNVHQLADLTVAKTVKHGKHHDRVRKPPAIALAPVTNPAKIHACEGLWTATIISSVYNKCYNL